VSLVCEEEVEQAVADMAVRAAVAVTSAILADGRAERKAGTVDMRSSFGRYRARGGHASAGWRHSRR
jgi:hypothetical protein